MSKFLNKRSILFVFISIFIVVTIIASLSVFLVFQFRLSDIIIEEKKNDAMNTSNNISGYIQNSLDSELNIVKGVSNTLEIFETLPENEQDLYMEDVLNDSKYLLSLEILDDEFNVTNAYPETDEYRVGYNIKYFVQNMGYVPHLSYAWSNPYSTPSFDEVVISLIYKQDNHFIFATYSLTFFEDIYNNVSETSTDSNLIILDRHGIYVFDSEGERELQRMKYNNFDIVKDEAENKESFVTVINGREAISATSYVPSQNWYVVYYEGRAASLEFFSDITVILLVSILGIITIYLLGILHSMGIVKASINTIYKSMKRVTSGDYGFIVEDIRFKEFNDIRTEFNDMSTSLEMSTNRLKNLAYYDQLTGVHSRAYLNDYFTIEYEDYTEVVCLYIDINRFQIINDSYGYRFGNEVIKQFAKRLSNLSIGRIKVFKSEGDEFILILSDSNSIRNLTETVQYISSLLKKPYHINQSEISIELTIGASQWFEETKNVEQLITQSIIAMNDAKKDNFSNFKIYNPLQSETYQRRLEIEMAIDNAFKNDEFEVVLHPIVYTDSKEIRGFEALSRWHHETMGLIGPVEYISILERAKKIHKLDMLVLEKSLIFLGNLKEEYVISVNLSVDTIIWPEFSKTVIELIEKYQIKPSLLELEITESTIVQDYNVVQKIISELRQIGVRFSEDDFGDGYSALNYLHKLELNTLKISKNLTNDLAHNQSSQTLVKHIIALANELNLDTIIEGVETQEVYEICKTLKCDYIQGYYFYKPLSISQVEELVHPNSNN